MPTIAHARRLLHDAAPAVAGAVGALLAWPLDPDAAVAWRVGAVAGGGVVALATAAERHLGAATRTLQVAGLSLLLVLAVSQRLDEPLVGLVGAIGMVLALVASRPGGDGILRSGEPGTALPTLLMVAACLSVPDALPLPRDWLLVAPVLLALAELLALARAASRRHEDVVDALLGSPVNLLVASFVGLAVAGTGLLLLPFSTTRPGSIGSLDALFTAVSASCVTGLAVLDTPVDFTPFGQLVILVLIQLGGLGIMAFATAAAVLLGRRLGVKEELAAAQLMGGAGTRADLESALFTMFRVTFVTELVGVLLLAPMFWQAGDTPLQALWRAVFTSISAFCNAGFALQSDSLVGYQETPGVLLVLSVVIVVGSLGPAVIATTTWARPRRQPLHNRLVLVTTAALLLVPFVAFLAIEWDHAFAGLGAGDRVVNAWFQSVTLRTAGFNAVDLTALQPASWTLSILAMLVGGSPGSTAGGAKTTTLAVLMLAVWAAVRGHHEAEAFGRRIPHRTVYEAAAIVTVFLILSAGALLALQLTQELPLDEAIFEVVSALATVGLSTGATGRLDAIGKLVITACMFAGRVGPLTVFILLAGRSGTPRRYPLEAVQVG
ncbi:MAG: potassium transporter TrkH [Alphaproteobacteria bacterium]|nr:potassium transporter TrkH [Alphaproteobacteria bacterium]